MCHRYVSWWATSFLKEGTETSMKAVRKVNMEAKNGPTEREYPLCVLCVGQLKVKEKQDWKLEK